MRQQVSMSKLGISDDKIIITESLGLRNQEHHIRTLHQIKELGCKLSMDDFGTGYSSLSYLHSLPIDTLKINQSFIFGIPSSSAKMKLTKTIISMAQSFDLNIIAEGIEEDIQLDFIKLISKVDYLCRDRIRFKKKNI